MSHSQLLDFTEFVQNFHPAIKFTYEISEQSVAFLDMDISLKQGKRTTSVHYKATDSHSYLDYRSSHNPSMKNGIPSSQFLRLRRLCSDDTDFKEKAEEMVEFFIQRHYTEDIIRTALQKVRTIPHQQTLQPNDKTATEKKPMVSLLYHPSTNRVRKIIQSNWSLLQSYAKLAAIFSQPPLIAYKCDTNIHDMLVRSKQRQPATRTPGTTPCNQAKCGTCPFICRHQHQRYWH